jgi:hypothetical protein
VTSISELQPAAQQNPPIVPTQIQRSLSVTGYPQAAVALNSAMKAKLEADYGSALTSFKDPAVAAVAEFLQRKFPGNGHMRVVASGGVAEGPNARRVEVLVS